jgi:coatomer subunit beta
MLIMTSIIRVGQSQFVSAPIDEDSQERISTCLQSLASFEHKSAEEGEVRDMFLKDTQQAYAKLVAHDEKKAAEKRAKDSKKDIIQADDLVSFRMFKKGNAADDGEDEYTAAMTKAAGVSDSDESLLSKLSRVVQLTGFSDPVYAEAYVHVHQFDIILGELRSLLTVEKAG